MALQNCTISRPLLGQDLPVLRKALQLQHAQPPCQAPVYELALLVGQIDAR